MLVSTSFGVQQSMNYELSHHSGSNNVEKTFVAGKREANEKRFEGRNCGALSPRRPSKLATRCNLCHEVDYGPASSRHGGSVVVVDLVGCKALSPKGLPFGFPDIPGSGDLWRGDAEHVAPARL